jgi:hypothetical protein
MTYLASHVTAPLVLPSEVAVEELTRSLSGASALLEVVSEALGISLSKVHDLYFRDMDKVRRERIIEEAQERQQEDRKYEEEREEANERERQAELQLHYEDDTF